VLDHEIPGWSYALSNAFNAAQNLLITVENWVEKGIAPQP